MKLAGITPASFIVTEGRMAMPDETYTAPEVATLLQVSEDRVRRLAVALHIGRKHGRDWLFSAADVAVLRARNTQRGRPPMRGRYA